MKDKKHFLVGATIIGVYETLGPMIHTTEIETNKGYKIIINEGDAGTMRNPEPSFSWKIEKPIKREIKRRKITE